MPYGSTNDAVNKWIIFHLIWPFSTESLVPLISSVAMDRIRQPCCTDSRMVWDVWDPANGRLHIGSCLQEKVAPLARHTAYDATRAYVFMCSSLSLSICELLGSIKCCTAPFALGGKQSLGFTSLSNITDSCQKGSSFEHKAASICPCESSYHLFLMFLPTAICKPHYCTLERNILFNHSMQEKIIETFLPCPTLRCLLCSHRN